MNRLEPAPLDLPADKPSDIIHLVCCRVPAPIAEAFCGWQVTEIASAPGPECVVCDGIAAGLPPGECHRGGRCPE